MSRRRFFASSAARPSGSVRIEQGLRCIVAENSASTQTVGDRPASIRAAQGSARPIR
jgi:hypothetical protein